MATPRTDIESVSAAIEAFIKQKLNPKLLEIDAEKNDGLTLLPIPDAGYFFEYTGPEMGQFNPCIVYGFEDMGVAERLGPATSTAVRMSILVLLKDDGNDRFVVKRLLRYQRALKEIFEKDWNGIGGSLKFAVGGAPPMPLNIAFRGEADRVIGVTLEYTLA